MKTNEEIKQEILNYIFKSNDWDSLNEVSEMLNILINKKTRIIKNKSKSVKLLITIVNQLKEDLTFQEVMNNNYLETITELSQRILELRTKYEPDSLDDLPF
jgi:hypothetical protein